MTCIVGLEQGGVVYMAGDSAGVSGNDITPRDDPKVFRKGTFLYGYAGSFRLGQLLRYKFDAPAHDEHLTDHAYLATDYVDTLRSLLDRNGLLRKREEVSSMEGLFLLGYRRHLYSVLGDFQVGQAIDDFDAIGSGFPYAVGAMAATETAGLHPIERVTRALAAASRYSTGVRGPFLVKTLEIGE